ncbi:MAG: motility associated factor glycosyltransferase family protein [Phycisphaerales bacterium]
MGATFRAGAARALCSRRGPMQEARRIAESIDVRSVAAVAMCGFGAGYLVRAVSEKMKRSGVIVVFEPDVELLRSVLERIDHSAWLSESNVVLITDSADTAGMSAALSGVEGLVMMGATLLDHPACAQRLQRERPAFHATFQQVVQAIRTMVATTLVQVDTTIRNLVTNIGFYASADGIADLAGVAQGRRGIVVSAGPSLERNIDVLARPGVRERCVIIAAQTVLKPLLRRGIKPHFVTALDHSEISARFYEGLTASDVEGVTLVMEPKASPAIPRAFPGTIRCVQDKFLDAVLGESLSKPMGRLSAGATVAHLAYYLARHLGCDPVVLMGQDLGFTDGQYYASGAAIHDVWAAELNEFCTLEMLEWTRIKRMGKNLRRAVGVDGESLYTDEQMSTYQVQFERDFASDAAKGLTTIDATEGGVRKAHTLVQTLEAALASGVESGPHGIEGRGGRTACAAPSEDVMERLRIVQEDLGRVGEICEKTRLALVEMLEHHQDQPRVNRLIGRVDDLRGQIERINPAYQLAHFHNQAGAFQRIRADRAIHLDAELSPMERQRRAIERDERNVKGLGESARRVGRILSDAAGEFEKAASSGLMGWASEDEADDSAGGAGEAGQAGPPGLDRSQCFSTLDMDDEAPRAGLPTAVVGVAGEIGGVTEPPRVWAVIPLNLSEGVTGLKYRPALESIGTELVIQRTLSRLACVRNAEGIVVLTNRPEEARRLTEGANRRLPFVVQRVEQFRTAIERDRIRGARAWARTCWRGGIGGATCYDEVFYARATLEGLRQVGGSAALLAGPDWCFIDPRLCEEVIDRHMADPAGRRLTFSLAPPGLGGCVVERSLVGTIAGASEDPRWAAPIGRLLSYIPTAPTMDPIGTGACVSVPARVRDCGMRFIADSEVVRTRLERMWQGLAGTFMEPTSQYVAEAVRIDAERAPDVLPEEVVAEHPGDGDARWLHWVIESLGAGGSGRALTIRCQSAADDPNLVEVVQHARERRVNVHVRLPGTSTQERMRSILVAGPEVVSVEFLPGDTRGETDAVREAAMESGTALVSGALRELAAGAQIDQSVPATWIVPRIARREGMLGVIESCFDEWSMKAGCAVIDQDAVASGRIRALALPASYRRRLARTQVWITDGGFALADPAGTDRSMLLGRLTERSLEECWADAMARRREQGWFA